MNAIEINKLYKSYNGKENALEDMNLKISPGEIFGFLGPNGSGKTTTVRILNGILRQSSGEAKIHGFDNINESKNIHKLCGVMTETAKCYENLTAEENLDFFGGLHDIESKDLNNRKEQLLKELELYEYRNKKVREYSTGMKKRLALSLALINNPKVLFLDEPTSGLDPENALNVLKLIKKMVKDREATIFMCTHQLKYAEEICSSYGFIDKGRLLAQGSFQELLKQKNAKNSLLLRGENIKISGLKFQHGVYCKDIDSDNEAYELIKEVVNKGGIIYEAKQKSWSLEELYFSFMRGDKND